jgi:hypothetical protein
VQYAPNIMHFFLITNVFWVMRLLLCKPINMLYVTIISIVHTWDSYPTFFMFFAITKTLDMTNLGKTMKNLVNVHLWLHATCSHLQLDLGILQLQDQISIILIIFTTMMQLLKFSSYWLDRFYIHFHPLIGWYVPLITIVTTLVAS